MAGPNKEQVIDALRTVNDPELHRDLVSLNMVKNVAVCDGHVRLNIELTTPACPLKDRIRKDVESAVRSLGEVKQVDIEWSARVRGNPMQQTELPGVRNVIAVGAGKGGVGKSTVAAIVAVGLKRSGATVGLLDADVYGPSIPKIFGIEDERPQMVPDPEGRSDPNGQPLYLIDPIVAEGIKIISVGNIIPRDQAMVVRGPIVHGTIKQFLGQTDWGELDYLVVDLPPGTGDVALTLAQSVPLTGAVIVCTPQDIALLDAVKALRMYQKLNIPILGIVENMSYYLCPKCGHRDEIFDHGGARVAANQLGVPFLGEIPINVQIRINTDRGNPTGNFTETDARVAEAIEKVVQTLAGQISVRNLLEVARPTLSVE
jgi:ATP-binding protein involved in chromosome partitioning